MPNSLDQIISAKEWNQMVKTQIQSALGGVLDGTFVAAPYAAGFNYAVKQQYYNADTLSTLDLLVNNTDEIPSLGGSFSTSSKNLMEGLGYRFSKDDLAKMNQEETQQGALVGVIIDSYTHSELDDEPKKYPTISYIMRRITEVTKQDFSDIDVRKYPTLATLCRNLSEYTRLGVFTMKMHNAWSIADKRLSAVVEHITTPTEPNGGINTNSSTFNIGWDKLPETAQLLNQLKGNNTVTISLETNSVDQQTTTIHFDTKVTAKVPLNWLFNLTISHEHSYDLSKFAQKGSELSISVTYNGITTVPAIPTPLSADNTKGWYALDILNDAATNSGENCTGIQLLDPNKYKKYFGENGELRRLKTFVISQPPSITLHFEKFQCEELKEVFVQNTDVKFSILGGLISGDHCNDYSFTNYKYDGSSNTLDVTIAPEAIGASGELSHQVAFILGGVMENYPTNR